MDIRAIDSECGQAAHYGTSSELASLKQTQLAEFNVPGAVRSRGERITNPRSIPV